MHLEEENRQWGQETTQSLHTVIRVITEKTNPPKINRKTSITIGKDIIWKVKKMYAQIYLKKCIKPLFDNIFKMV